MVLISLRPRADLGAIFHDRYNCFNEIKAASLNKSAFIKARRMFAFRIARASVSRQFAGDKGHQTGASPGRRRSVGRLRPIRRLRAPAPEI